MSLASDLPTLQALDLEIDEAKRSLGALASLRGESQELREARNLYTQAQEERSRLARHLRALELDLEELREKIAGAEAMLYGGSIKNPKELSSLEQEVRSFQRRQTQLEEEALEVMARVEQVEGEQRAHQAELDRLEGAWEQSQSQLSEEESRTKALLHQLEQQRAKRVARLAPEILDAYEDLRQRKGGRAVAAVEGSACRGCGVDVPPRQIQELLGGAGLVYCSNCERILYLKD